MKGFWLNAILVFGFTASVYLGATVVYADVVEGEIEIIDECTFSNCLCRPVEDCPTGTSCKGPRTDCSCKP